MLPADYVEVINNFCKLPIIKFMCVYSILGLQEEDRGCKERLLKGPCCVQSKPRLQGLLCKNYNYICSNTFFFLLYFRN